MKKKKKRRNSKKIYNIFGILLFVSSIVFIYAFLVLDILIMKYLLILLGVIIIINGLNIFLLKRKNNKIRVFASICSVFMSVAMLFVSNYIFKTNGVLLGSSAEYKTYDFSVAVLKDSDYEKLDDLDGLSMGYYDNDTIDSKLYLDKLSKKIDIDYEKYDSYSDLTNSLTDYKVESIVIEDSYLSMLEENEDSNFNEEIRIIYTFSIRVKVDNISKDIDVTKKPFNIYISGMDEYGEVNSVSRSDVNIIVTVNPKTRQILLTSIPRDYYVQIHGTTGYKDKLTHAGLYGVEASVSTIEDLLDIDINYYIKVNFSSLVKIVDSIDGVDVYSEYDFTSRDGFHYSKGYNKVNGEEALSFARERKAFTGGDNQRGRNQQALLEAMIRKCTSSSIIYKYNSLLNSINGSFITNMNSKRITSLIKMQLSNMKGWNITSNNLTGSDGSEYTYSYSSQKLYVMIPDSDSILEAKELIKEVMDGEELESSYAKDSSDVHSVTKSTSQNNNSSNQNTTSNNNTSNTTSNNTVTDNNSGSNGNNKSNEDIKQNTTNNDSNVNNSSTENVKDNNKVDDDKNNEVSNDDESSEIDDGSKKTDSNKEKEENIIDDNNNLNDNNLDDVEQE